MLKDLLNLGLSMYQGRRNWGGGRGRGGMWTPNNFQPRYFALFLNDKRFCWRKSLQYLLFFTRNSITFKPSWVL